MCNLLLLLVFAGKCNQLNWHGALDWWNYHRFQVIAWALVTLIGLFLPSIAFSVKSLVSRIAPGLIFLLSSSSELWLSYTFLDYLIIPLNFYIASCEHRNSCWWSVKSIWRVLKCLWSFFEGHFSSIKLKYDLLMNTRCECYSWISNSLWFLKLLYFFCCHNFSGTLVFSEPLPKDNEAATWREKLD